MHRLAISSCLLVLCSGGVFDENNLPSGRIVGGHDIDISEAPYQLAVESNGWNRCGATLIADRFALTSGYCAKMVLVSSGYVRTGSSLYEEGGTIIPLRRIINHPKYHDAFDYNIALLELESPVQFDENSQAVKIAETEPVDGDIVQFSGWGSTVGREGFSLKAVEIPILARSTCRYWYSSNNVNITDRMICAAKPGKAPCGNDIGGPVVLNGTLVGINSFSIGCGIEFLPSVANSVANPEIRDFIYRNTGV